MSLKPLITKNAIEKVFQFLEEIGIEFKITDEPFDSFLQGVKIEKGALKINPDHLLCLGDILHESGHLACIPANLRPQATDNIAEAMGEEHTYEMAVIAWSVAAAIHLNIPLAEIFHEQGYNCLLYTSPSPRDRTRSRMPSSA